MDGYAEGWLDGAADTEGGSLGTEVGPPVLVGLKLGWREGATEVDGLSEGINVGCADTLGNSDGIDVGTPVIVGLMLG